MKTRKVSLKITLLVDVDLPFDGGLVERVEQCLNKLRDARVFYTSAHVELLEEEKNDDEDPAADPGGLRPGA